MPPQIYLYGKDLKRWIVDGKIKLGVGDNNNLASAPIVSQLIRMPSPLYGTSCAHGLN